jgi:hypothetical protein
MRLFFLSVLVLAAIIGGEVFAQENSAVSVDVGTLIWV